jgi:hypothetical protein
VAVVDHDRNNCFALLFRAVSEVSQNMIISKIVNYEGRIVLKWAQFISFCPWCGKDLKKFYKNHVFKNANQMDSFVNRIF